MNYFKDIIRGMVIGVANAIPGVSGGTMMVSMGIYDSIIYCVTHLFQQFKKSVLTLLPYFIGMAIGIVGLAYFIKAMYANAPFQTSMLFIGLILGGIPVLTERLKGKKIGFSHGLVFFIFFLSIIFMQYFGGSSKDAALTLDVLSLLKLFAIGVVASATMVIPGVSGSMMLMILGYYNPIIHSITDVISALTSGNWAEVFRICGVLIPFGLGVVIGIFAVAKLIEILLHRHEALTYCGIMGLVVSSPVVILMGTVLASLNVFSILTGIAALAAGVVIALCLGK